MKSKIVKIPVSLERPGRELLIWANKKSLNAICVQTQSGGGDGGIRTHVPISRQNDFESFPAYDFWWKLSEDGSTQRKPKSCGILRILASVFRFYLNPPGFPSSSRFCPEL